jgi:hypothetical protein
MQQPETLKQPPLRDLHPPPPFGKDNMAVLICGLKPLKCSCLVLGKKPKTSCMLGKCSATDPIPNSVCSSLNKLCAVFLTLISGELALQISANCKNLTLQQPCLYWEGYSSCEKTSVHHLVPRVGHVGWFMWPQRFYL